MATIAYRPPRSPRAKAIRRHTLIYLGLLHEETASEMARAEARELQMQETVVCPK